MKKKTLENKTKRSLWEDIKTSLKIAVPITMLTMPAVTNIGGYISTNMEINNMETPAGKEMIAEVSKEVYQNAGTIGKICFFGDYLAGNNYLQENQ